MKKWIIILLMILLSSGLYLYYNNNWQQKSEQIAQFKTETDQTVEIEEEVEVELDRLTEEKDKEEITIISPFKSELQLEELEQEDREEESSSKEETSEKETEISRPNYKLLGILRIDKRALVTVKTPQGIERLTLGEVIDGFKLVEINKNNVVFEKERSFTFWLGDRAENEAEGGHQN
ncbi:MAG: hypothetical protein R6V17_02260 [Halanaerobacter sp.]